MINNSELKIISITPCYQGNDFIKAMTDSIYNTCYKMLFFHSMVSWKGQSDSIGNTCLPVMSEWKKVNDYADKIVNISCSFDNQLDHYTYAVDFAKRHYPEADLILVLDTDEIFDDENLQRAIQHIKDDNLSHTSYSCKMFTYLKSPFWRISPTEGCSPVFALNPKKVKEITGVRCNKVSDRKHFEDVKYHHMCYVRANDDSIRRKFKSIQIADQAPSVPTWITNVYDKINSKTYSSMKNVHPSAHATTAWQSIIKVNKSDLSPYLQKDPILNLWDEKTGDKV